MHLKLIVNLLEKWDYYKAARTAINTTVDSNLTMANFKDKREQIISLHFPIGLLALENFMDYKKLILTYDSILKWLILHSGMNNNIFNFILDCLKQKNLNSEYKLSLKNLLKFLTKLSFFEFKFRQVNL